MAKQTAHNALFVIKLGGKLAPKPTLNPVELVAILFVAGVQIQKQLQSSALRFSRKVGDWQRNDTPPQVPGITLPNTVMRSESRRIRRGEL